MSVIGRLDKQVEEILISPLDKNRQPDAPPGPAPTNTERPTGEAGQPKPAARTETSQDSPADELPVWLL